MLVFGTRARGTRTFKKRCITLVPAQVLCDLASAALGSRLRTHRAPKPFQARENVKTFLDACRGAGVRDLFETVDLEEGRGDAARTRVCRCLAALAAKSGGEFAVERAACAQIDGLAAPEQFEASAEEAKPKAAPAANAAKSGRKKGVGLRGSFMEMALEADSGFR